MEHLVLTSPLYTNKSPLTFDEVFKRITDTYQLASSEVDEVDAPYVWYWMHFRLSLPSAMDNLRRLNDGEELSWKDARYLTDCLRLTIQEILDDTLSCVVQVKERDQITPLMITCFNDLITYEMENRFSRVVPTKGYWHSEVLNEWIKDKLNLDREDLIKRLPDPTIDIVGEHVDGVSLSDARDLVDQMVKVIYELKQDEVISVTIDGTVVTV